MGKKKSKTGDFCSCCKTADLRVLIAGRDEAAAKTPLVPRGLGGCSAPGAGGLVGVAKLLNEIQLISPFWSRGPVRNQGRIAQRPGTKERAKAASQRSWFNLNFSPLGKSWSCGNSPCDAGSAGEPCPWQRGFSSPEPWENWACQGQFLVQSLILNMRIKLLAAAGVGLPRAGGSPALDSHPYLPAVPRDALLSPGYYLFAINLLKRR